MFVPYPAGGTRIMERSMDVAHFNTIANHPEVRPHLGGDVPVDVTAILNDAKNYGFKTAHGGFVLTNLADRTGRYNVHSMFTPEGRGAEAIEAMRETSEYMFTRTDCTEGRTTVPVDNPSAFALARRGGFERRFGLARMPWATEETKAADFLALSLERWTMTALEPLKIGRWFHDALHRVKDASTSALVNHPEEEAHDRMVGAAVMMVMGGQVRKAVAFYNCWANMANYATIEVLSEQPAVIDVRDAIVEARPDGMQVLLCR